MDDTPAPITEASGSPAAALRSALITWYDRSARALPWRRTRDPYAIWVSEIMLQQTRVQTVLRYYDAFLARFPTPHALAAASEDEVMAAWSGLGYYRRARNLHCGVREVVARYGGRVPAEPEARRALPGVGRYTAGAIGSIAFEREEPIVDGNVARVLCRIHGIDTPLSRGDTQRRLWLEAERLVRGPRPSALNQALMELGATVCTKQRPACARCPVRSGCRALAGGLVHALPRARAKPSARMLPMVALLATRGGGAAREVWLEKSRGTLFGGLWNLPMSEGRGRTDAARLLAALGLPGRLAARPHARIEHVLTHRRLRVELWCVEIGVVGERTRPESERRPARARRRTQDRKGERESAALRLDRLHEVGVSRLTHKALQAAGLDVQPRLELA